MSKRILSAIVTSIMAITAMMAQEPTTVVPDTIEVKDYVLNIGDFAEMTVADNLNVLYKFSTDSAGLATFTCDARRAPAYTFTNNKGKLKIETVTETPITGPHPTITVYSSCMAKATNLGDSTICLLSVNPSQKLSLKVMGNGLIQALGVYTTTLSAAVEAGSGHVFVTGHTQNAKITLAGTGAIEAGDLKADKASVWMLGTGSVDCSVATELAVYGAGTGTLYYVGNPKLKKRAVGVKLVKMDE